MTTLVEFDSKNKYCVLRINDNDNDNLALINASLDDRFNHIKIAGTQLYSGCQYYHPEFSSRYDVPIDKIMDAFIEQRVITPLFRKSKVVKVVDGPFLYKQTIDKSFMFNCDLIFSELDLSYRSIFQLWKRAQEYTEIYGKSEVK